MTIKPQQADYMNYSYFFKNNYRKGLDRLTEMLTDPIQFQHFIDNPVALSAAFGSDTVQTPALCEVVYYQLSEEKRLQVVNAYSSVFGYSNYNELLESDTAPEWQKRCVFLMTSPELTVDNLKFAVSHKIAIPSWIGKTIDLGGASLPDVMGGSDGKVAGIFTIIDCYHDELSDGSGKALFTFAYEDGRVCHNVDNNSHFLFQMNSTQTTAGGWAQCNGRTTIAKFTFNDPEIQALIKEVNKYSVDQFSSKKVYVTSDKFWFLSMYEMTGDTYAYSGNEFFKEEGEPYSHLVKNSTTRRSPVMGDMSYWTRTAVNSNSYGSPPTSSSSDLGYLSANSANSFVPCFCM